MMRRVCATVTLLLLTGCTAAVSTDDGRLRVVTTTEILADLARNVGGDRVAVDALVPAGGDPHSYEPKPSDAVTVSRAEVAFTNHLLLEEHALIKMIDANAPAGIPNVSLAEASETYGAHVIPLVEDVGLDVLWLGLAVRGKGEQHGATRSSDVQLYASAVDGPGALIAYLTGTLGDPQVYFNSTDGLDERDVAILPPEAHTHLNWAFTKPGVYRLTLTARLGGKQLGSGEFTFAVGVNPHTTGKKTVLGKGHTDLAVDLDRGSVDAFTDVTAGKQEAVPAGDVVIEVPGRALESIPDDPRFAFLGAKGGRVHQLPQAVLGKHVHGEIDPHLWQDVRNVKAYVQLIRDTLVRADPSGSEGYWERARAYLSELDTLDRYVRGQIAAIPREQRQLVTTHDAFGYLAAAYDLTVAGFVVPNPAQEPSVEQVRKLSETIGDLRVPAVFIEPNLARRAGVLSQVAADRRVRICKLYGDSFDEQAATYVAMMRHNADELRSCLGRAGGAGGGQIVIDDGHVDIGPRFVDGRWRVQLRDDTAHPSVWRELSEVVLRVGSAARIQLPDDQRFGFLGIPGEKVWVLPQVQRAGLVWPGWNTQDPQIATGIKREMTWRLHAVTGPGQMVLFLNGAFGEPQQVFHSGRPLPQETGLEAGTHVHGNWAFTAEGTYRLEIEMSAIGTNGAGHTDRQTLTFQVGDGPIATPAPPSPDVVPSAVAQPAERSGTRLWWLVPAVIVLIGLASWLWRRWRRA